MIVQLPDERLKKLCAVIADPTAAEWVPLAQMLLADMEAGDASGPGLGLSAPQVGACVQMFVMRGFPLPFVNPRVDWVSSETTSLVEGCLSIPFMRVTVERPKAITIRAQSLTGVWKKWKLRGMDARVAQHEMDHLNGVLITDHALKAMAE